MNLNFTKFVCTASVVSAIFAVGTAASADCNCQVPPSPIGAPMNMAAGPWNGFGPPGNGGYEPSQQPYAGAVATNGPHWAPGGYEGRVGSPAYYHDPSGGQYVVTGDPYYDHFGPGFQRQSLHGHYRFPYYNYRAPWYFPGRAVYNRNTNFAW